MDFIVSLKKSNGILLNKKIKGYIMNLFLSIQYFLIVYWDTA